MVQAPVRVRVPIAEKYVNMRTQRFTRTHARAMQQWLNDGRGDEDGYYDDFRKEVERTTKRWELDCAAIDRDANLSFREKREEKNKLNRVYPAWTYEQEERFINQWGDPRLVDRSRLESALANLESPQWDSAMRGNQIAAIDKKPWERKFYEAIMNPQDGSLPLYMNAAEIRVAEPQASMSEQHYDAVTPTAPTQLIPQKMEPPTVEVEPPLAPGDYITEEGKAAFKKHIETIAKRTCPFCRTYFPGGLKPQHKGGAICKATQEKNR